MINIESAKSKFDQYAKQYNLNDEVLKRKYYHSYRVMKISKNLAEEMNLEKDEIDLATLIGLLHDIARFEQWTRYGTFSDLKSIDHGNLGVEILRKNDFITQFVKEDKYNEIILKAIDNHNKFAIAENLNEKELKFAKIIRDADKLDIFYEVLNIYYEDNDKKEELENGIIDDDLMNDIILEKPLRKKVNAKLIDRLLVVFGLIFDLNFTQSLLIVKNEDYINKIVDKFNFKNTNTKEKMEEIRKIVNNYIQKRTI